MDKKPLAIESLRLEEDALYSSRGHFAASTYWRRMHYWLGVPMTILAAIAGASAIADQIMVAGVVSLFVTGLSALTTFLNPSAKATQHHNAGTELNEVRNRARFFREIELPSTTADADAVRQLADLCRRRDDLNKASPPIPPRAFSKAKGSIERGEASHAIDRASSTAGQSPSL